MTSIIQNLTVLTMLFVASYLGLSTPSLAQDMAATQTTTPQIAPADFSPLKLMGTADVLKIIDPQTIVLHDGRTVRLSSVHFPDYSPHAPGEFSLLAKEILEDFLLGQTVNIYQTPKKDWGRVNRMGHQIAHIQRLSDKAWAQGLLLTLGLAQVHTTQRTPEMTTAMYALEAEARAQDLGLWADARYGIRTEDITQSDYDSFRIVEGRVQSVAIKSGRIYLNFGLDWRTDFTISIAPGNKRFFSKAQINPLDWNRRIIRARGWVRSYNGAFMDLDHPQAVELVN